MAIEALIARFGLPAIFAGAGIEGETVVVSGGVLAHEGLLPLVGVMAASAAGSFVADQVFFLIGRRFRDHPRVQRLAERPAFARALGLLERHPVGFVLGFRFLYGLRTISPIAIGTSHVPSRTFIPLNLVAALVWGVLFAGLGYAFGDAIQRAFGRLHSLGHLAAIVAGFALVVFGAGWLVRRRSRISGKKRAQTGQVSGGTPRSGA